MNFEYSQIQKWVLQTVRVGKVDEENRVICLVSMIHSWVMVFKLSKKSPERSRYALSENGIVYYAVTYCCGVIRVWSRKILSNFCWISIFFDILIANISWTVAQTSINHIISRKSVMRTLRSIYVNCFNRLGFLAGVSTKLQIMQFWTI